MNLKKYNTIYVWLGGTWKQAALPAGADFEMMINDMRERGEVAHYGHTDIGPPEGPPE